MTAIRVEKLGKDYQVPGQGRFKALDELSFELKRGEVLGLVGHNGAGKSTLLKILSRITRPSRGTVDIYGRLASLLEVGTGFHPELSGRENIYLNGSVLGMSRRDIKKQFDEIVAFAGTERFLDLPVKRYSSGMYLRLAFAVAAHLRADILLVDEVLAVGDAAFQKKCLQRMESLSESGERSIIFVSHNLNAINSLCSRCLLLENGTLRAEGPAEAITAQYLRSLASLNRNVPIAARQDRVGDGLGKINKLELIDDNGAGLISGQDARWRISVQFEKPLPQNAQLEINLFNSRGNFLSAFHLEWQPREIEEESELRIASLPLMPGEFFFNIHLLVNGQRSDFVGRAHYFRVTETELRAPRLATDRNNPAVYLEYGWKEL